MGTMPYPKGHVGIVKHVWLSETCRCTLDCILPDRSHLNVSVSDEISRRKSGQVGVVTNIMGTMPYPKGYVEIVKHVWLSETCRSTLYCILIDRSHQNLSVSDEISRRKSG